MLESGQRVDQVPMERSVCRLCQEMLQTHMHTLGHKQVNADVHFELATRCYRQEGFRYNLILVSARLDRSIKLSVVSTCLTD
jgi:hypothetical protein